MTVAAYTGRTDPADRERLEAALRDNEVKALVATSALGMGFDKPDLGFVVHLGAPVVAGGLLPAGGPRRPRHRTGRRAAAARARGPGHLALLRLGVDAARGAGRRPCCRPWPSPAGRCRRRRSRRPSTCAAPGSSCCSRCSTSTARCNACRGGWVATGVPWTYDAERYARVAAGPSAEQQLMVDYERTDACRMAFLQECLDDDTAAPCGRCDGCAGPWYPRRCPTAAVGAAARAAGRAGVDLDPRVQWPSGMDRLGVPVKGKISADEALLAGPRLARLTDLGWGQRLREVLRRRSDGPARRPTCCGPASRCWREWGWAQRPVARRGDAVPTRGRRWSARWPRGLAEIGRLPLLGSLDLAHGGPAGEPGGNSAFRLAGVWERLVVGPELAAAPGRRRRPGAARRRPGRLPVDPDRGRARAAPGRRRRGAALRARRRRLTILEGRPARHTGAIAAEPSRCGFAWRTLAHELHAKFMNSASLVRMTTENPPGARRPRRRRRGLAGAGWVSEHVAVELSPGADSRRRVAPDDGRGTRTDRRPSQCRGHQCGHPVVHRRGPLVDGRRRRLHRVAAATKPSRR